MHLRSEILINFLWCRRKKIAMILKLDLKSEILWNFFWCRSEKIISNVYFLNDYSKRKLLCYVLLYFSRIIKLHIRFIHHTGIKLKNAELTWCCFSVKLHMMFPCKIGLSLYSHRIRTHFLFLNFQSRTIYYKSNRIDALPKKKKETYSGYWNRF